ncbi:zinc finger CCCH domain-containing protein 14-like [Xenia sp. Carnegie-2017]|uniref:zinc finger CCCH domain-containing protein 14-like n=1 Tax=Xenia sp. Carnegie-2017 TaxID=2897299 RepID=UPI001F04025D|nr:zinc finger CCCH domain-containing protein 14-like [Xenia sp. Carnegie-2017]
MEIGNEITQKIKTAIKTKLVEYGSYVDDELPDYIMVMIANKRSQAQMIEDLNLFLGDNSKIFCEWLHDLLSKLQEVTEGAFEVKVPLKRKSAENKTLSKSEGNNAAAASKSAQKHSPIRMNVNTNDIKDFSQDTSYDGSGKKRQRADRQDEKKSGLVQSAITVQKKPSLSPSKQANALLLKKAMHAAQASTVEGEYNPERPSTTQLPVVSDAETKKQKKEQLMAEHKKLQRIKSQQEEEKLQEPMIELQAAEDDDLFKTEDKTGVKDRRIVVERSPERDTTDDHESEEHQWKGAKRKIKNGDLGDINDGEKENSKEKNVKTREKRKKPKFIVTLEGVESKFEEMYEKEHSRKKRRRKTTDVPDAERDIPVMPVYPQFVHGVHQVPGIMSATPVNHDLFPPHIQSLHVIPPRPSFTSQAHGATAKPCKHFPNCRYGNDCVYSHPPCKFGSRCTSSSSCPYSHDNVQSLKTNENERIICRYYPHCSRPNCVFLHIVDKPWQYGKTSHITPPPRDQLKWVAPAVAGAKVHISERKFAVKETSTTALPVQ